MVRYTVVSTFWDETNSAEIKLIEGACLHDDVKPNNLIATGSIMTEVDTGDVYMFAEGESGGWTKQMSLQG